MAVPASVCADGLGVCRHGERVDVLGVALSGRHGGVDRSDDVLLGEVRPEVLQAARVDRRRVAMGADDPQVGAVPRDPHDVANLWRARVEVLHLVDRDVGAS